MLFSKPTKAVGLDIGSHSVKAVQMSKHGGRLRVDNVGFAFVDRTQFNMDPVVAQASALREAVRTVPLAGTYVVGALPGQTVVIRYPRLPEMDDAQLANSIEREAGQNIPYERSEVFLDWTPLDRVTEGTKTMLKVLLVAARYEVVETRVQIAHEAEISYSALGVDSLALADAAEGCDFLRVGETVALINIGQTTTSIHFVKDGISNFIRDISWGSRELIQAIAKARRVEISDAEKLLFQSASEEPTAVEPPPLPEMDDDIPESPPPEESKLGGLDELGGGLLDPLEEELSGLDSAHSPSSAPAAQAVEDKDVGEVLATPLARLVSEIRRSFDYYEQQLYEHPVDRLIVSGGVAHLPLLRETVADELGVSVELADPTRSALVLGPEHNVARMLEQPAQFMVAVGLAARGMADL
ncbi:MAG: type IV pilus assembly protein PilM [Candidatus Hydrogenedentes bacterium]|nr:type IV pilus assembly protein PilM [Candidatus Hydrogenedentota bacterium]